MPSLSRLKIFALDAAVAILAFLVLQTAAVKTIQTIQKVRWAFQVIDQLDRLGPDNYSDLIPPPPGRKDKTADLAAWVRQNLPRAATGDYRTVGAIFLQTAEKLRSGQLDGKREAYADTARELSRAIDRGTWTAFITALVKRAETETGDLADLFETVGRAIQSEAPAAAPEIEEGGRIE